MEERYDLLCEDVKHQISFIYDFYQFDFNHLNETLKEMKELQEQIRKRDEDIINHQTLS